MDVEFDAVPVLKDLTAPIAAKASAPERSMFIVFVFVQLLLAQVAFAVLEMLWFVTPVGELLVSLLQFGPVAPIACLVCAVVISGMAEYWAKTKRVRLRAQYLALTLYTVVESLLWMPLFAYLVFVWANADQTVLPRGIVISLSLFGCLALLALLLRRRVTTRRAFIVFAVLSSVAVITFSLRYGVTAALVVSYASVDFACVYMLLRLRVMLHTVHTDQHATTAMWLLAVPMLPAWHGALWLHRRYTRRNAHRHAIERR